MIDTVLHIDGIGRDHLVMKAGGSFKPTTHATVDAGENYLFQDGKFVYKHAVTDMYTSTLDICRRNGLTMESVGGSCPHQANLRIIEAVSSRAGIDPPKCLSTSSTPATHRPPQYPYASTSSKTSSSPATRSCSPPSVPVSHGALCISSGTSDSCPGKNIDGNSILSGAIFVYIHRRAPLHIPGPYS